MSWEKLWIDQMPSQNSLLQGTIAKLQRTLLRVDSILDNPLRLPIIKILIVTID